MANTPIAAGQNHQRQRFVALVAHPKTPEEKLAVRPQPPDFTAAACVQEQPNTVPNGWLTICANDCIA